MKPIVLATLALGYVAGVLRPGFIFALGMFSYPIEAYLGGHAIVGTAMIAMVPAYAVMVLFKRRCFHFHMIDALFLVFILWYCICALRAPDHGLVFNSMIKFAVGNVGYYFATRVMLENEKDFNAFAKDFLRMAVVMAIIVGVIAQPDPWSTRTFISYPGGKTHTVGVSLCFNVAVCALAFYIMSSKPWRAFFVPRFDQLLSIAALLLIFHFTIQNGTRGALMGPIAAIILFSLIYLFSRLDSAGRVMLVGGCTIAILCLPIVTVLLAEAVADLPPDVLAPKFKATIINLAGTVTGIERYQAFEPSALGRLAIYRHAHTIVAEWPLLGMGLNAVLSTIGTHAHNLVLELWTDGGIVNVVLFVAFVLGVLIIGARNSLAGPVPVYSRMFLGVAAGVLIQLQVSLTLADAKPLFFALGALVTLEVARLRALAHAHAAAAQASEPPAPMAVPGGAALPTR